MPLPRRGLAPSRGIRKIIINEGVLMNRRVMKSSVGVILATVVLSLAVVLSGCGEDSPKVVVGGGGDTETGVLAHNVTSIYYRTFPMIFHFTEYKIDFEGKRFLKYTVGGTSDGYSGYRDTTAENEGFMYVGDLSNEKIAAFWNSAEEHGFLSWESRYECVGLEDGYQWVIEIEYADGTKKQVTGSNLIPDAWANMRIAFENLTDESILSANIENAKHCCYDIIGTITNSNFTICPKPQ